MTPLPRLLAYLDAHHAVREDLGLRLAAVAAVGPEVALVARHPGARADALTRLAARCVANATPPAAEVWVTGRVDVALAAGAHGVIRRCHDLPVPEMRKVVKASTARTELRHIASVHSEEEARDAADLGADALVVGTIWPTESHPGGIVGGVTLLRAAVATGIPCYAIGGVTVDRVAEAHRWGAYGIAVVSALWNATDSYRAARELLGH